jgi:hypothetical protein
LIYPFAFEMQKLLQYLVSVTMLEK